MANLGHFKNLKRNAVHYLFLIFKINYFEEWKVFCAFKPRSPFTCTVTFCFMAQNINGTFFITFITSIY